jgi:hypothetical protein
MDKSPWEATSSSDSQEIPCILCKPEIHYHVHSNRTLVLVLFLIVMCAPSSVFCVLFVCKNVLYYCHQVSTKLLLNNSNNNNNIQGETNPAHASPPYFLKIYFNIIAPSTITSCKWYLSLRSLHQNPVRIFPLLHSPHSPAISSYIVPKDLPRS